MKFEQRGQSLRTYNVCDYTSILCERNIYAPTKNGHYLTCAQSKTIDNYALILEVDGADSATSACKDWPVWYKNVISLHRGFPGIQARLRVFSRPVQGRQHYLDRDTLQTYDFVAYKASRRKP